VLGPEAKRIWCQGEPELAELLREAGLQVVEEGPASARAPTRSPPDAILIAAEGDAAVAAAAGAGANLGRGGLVAIPVGGGGSSLTGSVSRPVRALQLSASAFTAIGTGLTARRIGAAMRRGGLEVSQVWTGERARPRYGLGRGGWYRRLRFPVGSIVVGAAGERWPSIVEVATERAAEELGSALTRRATNVFASGKLGIELSDANDAAFFLWLAAGPAREEVARRTDAVRAIAHANSACAVRPQVVQPIAAGRVGPADYVLEPKVHGRHLNRMTSRLWQDCLEFLTALHRLPAETPTIGLRESEPDLPSGTEILARHVGPDERHTLERLRLELADRLDGVPRGGGHGDYWRENLIVRRGRLRAVLDWEWASRDSLPMLDLLDLIGHLGWRQRRVFDPGPTFMNVLWPLAESGGGERVRDYCAATGIPADARTLQALTAAHWLLRTARFGSARVERLQSRDWLGDNVLAPLARLRSAFELG
jgi:aminoglycoside phosphotransferase (APT) family kinase protein